MIPMINQRLRGSYASGSLCVLDKFSYTGGIENENRNMV